MVFEPAALDDRAARSTAEDLLVGVSEKSGALRQRGTFFGAGFGALLLAAKSSGLLVQEPRLSVAIYNALTLSGSLMNVSCMMHVVLMTVKVALAVHVMVMLFQTYLTIVDIWRN